MDFQLGVKPCQHLFSERLATAKISRYLLATINLSPSQKSQFHKRLCAVHPVQQQPDDRERNSRLKKAAVASNPREEVPDEDVPNLPEVEEHRGHVDREGVCADDHKAEGPFPITANIDNQIERCQQQTANPTGNQNKRAGPKQFDDRKPEAP